MHLSVNMKHAVAIFSPRTLPFHSPISLRRRNNNHKRYQRNTICLSLCAYGFCGPIRTISIDTTTIIVLHDPKAKSMGSRRHSVMKDWTPIVFPLYHSQDCYWISCVKTSVVWKLNVTCGATIELVRALRMSIRAWGEVYIVCYSRWVFVCTDVTCPM